jgi:hypothetical protein
VPRVDIVRAACGDHRKRARVDWQAPALGFPSLAPPELARVSRVAEPLVHLAGPLLADPLLQQRRHALLNGRIVVRARRRVDLHPALVLGQATVLKRFSKRVGEAAHAQLAPRE